MNLLTKPVAFCLACASIVVITSQCASAPTQVDCETLKNGTFAIRNDSTGRITTLTRAGKRQYEVTQGETDTLYMGLRWLHDCEYELNYLEGSSFVPDSLKEYARNHPIRVKIIEIGKDYYTYESRMLGLDYMLSDTAVKVK